MRQTAVPACALAAAVAAVAVGCGSYAVTFDRYVDPSGWSLRYPHGMHLERDSAEMRISVSEVTVASFRPRRAIRTGHTASSGWLRLDSPVDANGHFPKDGIAFRMSSFEGGPAPNFETPETRFPLQLGRFQRKGTYSDNGTPARELYVAADGRNYVAAVWIGTKASTASRRTLERLVSSVTFPKLRTGAVVGYRFTVLGEADRYPVGSFTRVRAQGQPFYLVHAPGGFYAIGWRWQSLEGGYKSRCALALDARAQEFYCTNMAARWDRAGVVIRRPAGATRDDPLNIAATKTSWDGHVLLAPGTASLGSKEYERKFWRS
jgi:hypothetical protein